MCLLSKDDQDEKCVEKYALLFIVHQPVCLVVQIFVINFYSCFKNLRIFEKYSFV